MSFPDSDAINPFATLVNNVNANIPPIASGASGSKRILNRPKRNTSTTIDFNPSRFFFAVCIVFSSNFAEVIIPINDSLSSASESFLMNSFIFVHFSGSNSGILFETLPSVTIDETKSAKSITVFFVVESFLEPFPP